MAQTARAKPFALEFLLDDSSVSRDIKATGFYEQFETGIIMQWVKRGYTAVDVGAHIGYYTLILSRLVEDIGKVFAFEPSVENYELLQKNVDLNKCSNVFIEQMVVSDKTGKTCLYLNGENKADNRISKIEKSLSIDVNCVRLDDYFRRYDSKIGFIKLDIQGAELKALQGMGCLLEKNEDVKLLIEFWPYGLRQCDSDPKELLDLLLGHGFQVFAAIKHKWKLERVDAPHVFLESFSRHTGAFTNLLCKRH